MSTSTSVSTIPRSISCLLMPTRQPSTGLSVRRTRANHRAGINWQLLVSQAFSAAAVNLDGQCASHIGRYMCVLCMCLYVACACTVNMYYCAGVICCALSLFVCLFVCFYLNHTPRLTSSITDRRNRLYWYRAWCDSFCWQRLPRRRHAFSPAWISLGKHLWWRSLLAVVCDHSLGRAPHWRALHHPLF